MIDPHPREKYGGIKSLCIISALAVVSWSALLLVLYGGYIVFQFVVSLIW